MKTSVSRCPNCGAKLDGKPIWKAFLEEYGDPVFADEQAARFGATRTSGRFSRIIAETGRPGEPTHYVCPDCDEEIIRPEPDSNPSGPTLELDVLMGKGLDRKLD